MKSIKKKPVVEFFTDHTECPNCGASSDEFIASPEWEHFERVDVFALPEECGKCGATWDDYYKLVGHANLKVKGKKVEIN